MDKELYQECVDKVINDRDKFSLNEEFNSHYDNVNAVTLITPTQTISRFNDDDMSFGSGFHGKNLQTILYAVYGKSFFFENSNQDIRIRYINYQKGDYGFFCLVIDVPKKITKSQVKSLINLNNELIKFEQENNCLVQIGVAIAGVTVVREEHNLDSFLNKLDKNEYDINVVDSYDLKYSELGMVGFPNDENHYNDSTFKADESAFRSSRR